MKFLNSRKKKRTNKLKISLKFSACSFSKNSRQIARDHQKRMLKQRFGKKLYGK